MFKRVLLVLVALVLAFAAYEWITFPDVAALRSQPPKTTAFMERRKAELREEGKDDTLQWKVVPYGSISPYLRRAVLVAEDDSFYEHEAVDVDAMKEAFQRNWKRGKITHGGSTITQQLAKNLYLSPSRNPYRKVKEYFIATALERDLTKKRILELYLNVVEMGERVYGAEAAARFYFHKSASSLTADEAALLAGCLPNPRIMNPGHPNKRLRWRQRMILRRMRRWGYLFEKEVLTEKKPAAATETAAPTETTATAPVTDTDLTPPPPTDTTATEAAPEPPPAETGTDSAAPATAPPPSETSPPPAPNTTSTPTP